MEHMDTELARRFVSGALGAAAQAYWETHLPTCRRCRELVAQERAWAGLAKLDELPPNFDGALDRVLAHVGPPSGRRSGWYHARRFGPAVSLAVLLGVALGLAYRLGTAPEPYEQSQDPMSILTSVERDAVNNLDVLQTLARDPWLIDDYEAVRWLEKRIIGDEEG